MFKGTGTVVCDGDTCNAMITSLMTTGEAAARKSAHQGGWSTARGRDLCEACTAKHNEAARAKQEAGA